MLSILRIIASVLFFTSAFFAQKKVFIPLNKPIASTNIDYTSYPNIFVLKHIVNLPFRKLPKNPVLQPGNFGWDAEDVSDPFVYQTADSLVMFYSGNGKSDEKYHIGYAVRDQHGWFWQKQNIIFDGSGAEWDSFHQLAPVVINYNGKKLLFYSGNKEDAELGYRMGLAIFENGKWVNKTAQPILPFADSHWDASGRIYADVIYNPQNDQLNMYYSGFSGPLSSIGLATSPHGNIWEKRGQPVHQEIPGVIAPNVIFNGESFTMYFSQAMISERGLQTKIRRAFSNNGISWSEAEDVLLPDAKWERGQLVRANVNFIDDRVTLYYAAGKGRWQIGGAYATATFTETGIWRTRISQNTKKISIAFKKPIGTAIRAKIILNDKSEVTLDLSNATPTQRNGVFRKTLEIPNLNANAILQIGLVTEDTSVSPVIYEVGLVQ